MTSYGKKYIRPYFCHYVFNFTIYVFILSQAIGVVS